MYGCTGFGAVDLTDPAQCPAGWVWVNGFGVPPDAPPQKGNGWCSSPEAVEAGQQKWATLQSQIKAGTYVAPQSYPCPPGHPQYPGNSYWCHPTGLQKSAEAYKAKNGVYPDWWLALTGGGSEVPSAAGGESSNWLYWGIGIAAVGAVGYFAWQALK